MDQPFAHIDQLVAESLVKETKQRAFLQAMMAYARRGHSCIQVTDHIEPALDCLGDIKDKEILEKNLIEGAHSLPSQLIAHISTTNERFNQPIGKMGDLYYWQRNWVLETRVIQEMKRLLAEEVKPLDIEPTPELNKQQQQALVKGLRTKIFCLSGGPGTGKTFTMSHLVKNFLEKQKQCVVLSAPTGKAVSELKKGMRHIDPDQLQIGTLHALLKIRSFQDSVHSITSLQGGLIIVDECSMIDLALFGALLKAVRKGSRLILVGDADQLPPVESGNVFGELCAFMHKHKRENISHLDICMRSDRQDILFLAQQIKQGKWPSKTPREPFDLKRWKHLFPFPTSKKIDPSEHLKRLNKARILSCVNEGPFGVQAINQGIWNHIRFLFRQGDQWPIPIIASKTDYHLGVANGEMGIWLKYSNAPHIEENDILFFLGDQGQIREIPAMLLRHFDIAYALSVHKSQGSEYETVILVVPKGSEIFGREILYTGVSRARTKLHIVGEYQTLKACSLLFLKKIPSLQIRLSI